MSASFYYYNSYLNFSFQLHTSISLPSTLKKCKSANESPCRGSNNCYVWALENQQMPANEVGGGCPKSQTTCGSVATHSNAGATKDSDNQLLLTSEQGISVDSSNERLTYTEPSVCVTTAAIATTVATTTNECKNNDTCSDITVRIEHHE